jgi:hypothetical protein
MRAPAPTSAEPARRDAGRLAPLALWAAGAAGLAGIAATDLALADLVASGPTLCPLRATTGLDCPFCGMTRGLAALASGRPLAAAGHNLLLVAAVPLAAWLHASWAMGRFGRRLPRPTFPPRTQAVALIALVAFAVARNLPLPALAWLGSG